MLRSLPRRTTATAHSPRRFAPTWPNSHSAAYRPLTAPPTDLSRRRLPTSHSAAYRPLTAPPTARSFTIPTASRWPQQTRLASLSLLYQAAAPYSASPLPPPMSTPRTSHVTSPLNFPFRLSIATPTQIADARAITDTIHTRMPAAAASARRARSTQHTTHITSTQTNSPASASRGLPKHPLT
jgi:hypothetical protein